ncbi:hypothetical protein GCM10009674_00370 [Nesterenkonia xinjiangensis]
MLETSGRGCQGIDAERYEQCRGPIPWFSADGSHQTVEPLAHLQLRSHVRVEQKHGVGVDTSPGT